MVIVDSYRISSATLLALKKFYRLAILYDYSDISAGEWADIIINYNIGAENIPYTHKSKNILGSGFTLIRPSFAKLTPSDDGFVLFLAGASDVAGVTVDVVTWYDTSWPPMVAVLGPMVPDDYFDKVSRMVDKKDGLTLMRAPSDFDGLMARASSVVCTSSVTCYEAMALGKPVVVFQVAENQRGIGRALSELGWGIDLGWWKDISPEILHRAIEKAFPPPAGCVPTDGAKRVASAILSMVR
jgi:spore coat polysaccharide biosynthesis predicted glycosyltransferase SpsG